ncbi:hypothetical protein ACH5RR_015682 [Cinchona calisaya]|uniref:Uncharacterized protein n=1 Tax=Cinchona calisaya TaxID=153742 RepID=A0ABD2ZV28_9GENT
MIHLRLPSSARRIDAIGLSRSSRRRSGDAEFTSLAVVEGGKGFNGGVPHFPETEVVSPPCRLSRGARRLERKGFLIQGMMSTPIAKILDEASYAILRWWKEDEQETVMA